MGPGNATRQSRSHPRHFLINFLLLYISSAAAHPMYAFIYFFKLGVATCWVTAGGIRETKLIKKTGDGDDTALCESFFFWVGSWESPELISLIQGLLGQGRDSFFFSQSLVSERMLWKERKAAGIETQRSTFRYKRRVKIWRQIGCEKSKIAVCSYLNSRLACVYLL